MKKLLLVSALLLMVGCGATPARQAVVITDSSWVRLGATPMKYGVRINGEWREFTHASKKDRDAFLRDHKGYLLIHPRYLED